MARWKKVVLFVVAVLVLVVVGAVQAVVGWRAVLFGPRARALTSRTFEATPARLERGRYLAEARHGCVFCHSERDWSAPGAPPRADRLGAGVVWTAEGMPWLTAPNLTPDPETGIGRASDDALARAIREGIGLDGQALFALMPYGEFRRLPDEDVAAIVVYLRSLPPIRNPLPTDGPPLPPERHHEERAGAARGAGAGAGPLDPREARGVRPAHVGLPPLPHPDEEGQLDETLDMAGGNEFQSPAGRAFATNLTPDPTGIAHYDAPTFLQVMRSGKLGTLHPMMPWALYSRMNDEDLGALFAYMTTLKPLKHVVTNGVEPTACVVCGLKHGGGDRNGT